MASLIPDLSDSSDGWQRLDPRFPAMARQAAWARLAVIGLVSGVLEYGIWWLSPRGDKAAAIFLLVWLLPLLLMGAGLFRLAVLRYRHSSWRLDGESLEIRRGAWWFTETRVPRSRIQHTDVTQGPIERHHGLGQLIIYTAGTHHGQIRLGGIAHDVAVSLRDVLLQSERDVPV